MIAAVQLGPIARTEPRAQLVVRMLRLMDQAAAHLVVYPELALTTFFPRWFFEDEAELNQFFETAMPNPEVQPLFDAARRFGIGLCFGYAERTFADGNWRHHNTLILVDRVGDILHKDRKVHLPGQAKHEPWRPLQHLEKRYFLPGSAGFIVANGFGGVISQAICNDSRWPETYCEAALQGAEVMLVGYNTPRHYPLAPEHDHLQDCHNHLCLQAGAYQNGMWVVAVAKTQTFWEELICYPFDLDRCREIRTSIFNLDLHRRPEVYTHLATRRAPTVD